MAVLRYQHAAKGTIVHELLTRPTVIGRSKECELYIDDSMLSRQHCEVRFQDGRYLLVDLKSKNGTHVNGSPIQQWMLKHGDQITIGNTSLVFKERK